MTINEILSDIRKNAKNTAQKGTKFENVILNYFLTEPVFANQIDHAWLWSDFPCRSEFGGHDIGVDIVFHTSTDEYWAVQCKCYDTGTAISKSAVDSFIATSAKSFSDGNNIKRFSRRYWVDSLPFALNKNAELAMQNQIPPVQRIGLDALSSSSVDWQKIYNGKSGKDALQKQKELREHQKEAIEKATQYYCSNERGKMIMACGSGKTFTSLRLAETMTNGKGKILFLVPSISLLSQTLMAWTSDANEKITPVCICSDAKVSSKKTADDKGFLSTEQLAEPATTDVEKIRVLIKQHQILNPDGMLVVFSTYQSIDVVSNAQKTIGSDFVFDLIISDEAHRTTTGVTLENEEESAFVRVHSNSFIKAKKRLYMTATPRLYRTEDQESAKEKNAYLCSMDDESLYGKEFYRLSFADAVKKDLLCDYKVIVLTMNRKNQQSFPQNENAENGEDKESAAFTAHLDEWQKLAGAAAALSKISLNDDKTLYNDDPALMHRAVAFCQSIKDSNKIRNTFNALNTEYIDKLAPANGEHKYVQIECRHVDGSMDSEERNADIQWLKDTPEDSNDCRILCNVRCLSEGVDVPSLDAAIFLSPRKSQVEIVQSVGRVMRKSEGKKFGYLIIPVIVDPAKEADKALEKNKDFQIVWSVACALRSHDDRFNLFVNNPDFNPDLDSEKSSAGGSKSSANRKGPIILDGEKFDFPESDLETKFYARMVQKVGDRRYWVQWAQDIAEIAERHIRQIAQKIETDKIAKDSFAKFLEGLRKNINSSVTMQSAIEMLAQHIITKPVFESLFEGSEFIASNPISKSMQNILDIINIKSASQEEEDTLNRFYDSVKDRASGVKTAEGRQKIILELYDSFFKNAFPKMVEQLGIVYTPVEVVDFIISSVSYVLQKEFKRNISDKNVNIIDPFTGTGTFIVRLLQSGLIKPEDFRRKYESEIRANEIVLLAYYIASINIENEFHSILSSEIFFSREDKKYTPFEGICLTDTFQLSENKPGQALFSEMFPVNSRRVQEQMETPIHIVIGNPPYSIGQKSANDNAQNMKYEKLDKKIEETYVANSGAALNKSCYDSYIRAFRWATDRLDPECGGIIGFVTNGAWLDNNGLDGFRKCLEKDFAKIYVFNLRGNQRTSGELSRKEGGKIFGSGSRNPIAITILVKRKGENKDKGQKAEIFYRDIGDYLTREQKLKILKNTKSIENLEMTQLHPNKDGDWISMRNDEFAEYIPVNPEKKFDEASKSVFNTFAIGVATNRDTWVYGFSKEKVKGNVSRMIDFYNGERKNYHEKTKNLQKQDWPKVENIVSSDAEKISWTVNLKNYLAKNKEIKFDEENFVQGTYRPFCRQNLYYSDNLIERPGLWKQLFPTKSHSNLIICVSGAGSSKDFTSMITDKIPCLDYVEKSQCFPLYYYTEKQDFQPDLFGTAGEDRYARRSAITDWILKQAQGIYGKSVEKEDIFYYVYGFLHSKAYRATFAADLKKMLPRIPLLDKKEEFWAFSKAGRALSELHLHYEQAEAAQGLDIKFSGEIENEYEYFAVEKLRFAAKDKKDTIIYNSHITISNIPLKAYEYVVNGRSAIEWLFDRYQVTADKASGIRNDCNDWAREHKNPRYIYNLLLSIINVSLKTVDIVNSLPQISFESGQDKKESKDFSYMGMNENFGALKVAEKN